MGNIFAFLTVLSNIVRNLSFETVCLRYVTAIFIVISYQNALCAASLKHSEPNFELAYAFDTPLCNKVTKIYNKILNTAVKKHLPGNLLSNFASMQADTFKDIGLFSLTSVELNYVSRDSETLSGTAAYFLTKPTNGVQPTVVAVSQNYRGNMPSSSLNFFPFNPNEMELTSAHEITLKKSMPPDKTIKPLSLSSLSLSQREFDDYIPGEYTLKDWPNFSKLLESYKAYLRDPIRSPPVPLPGLSTESLGVTIEPFQDKDNSLLFILDEYTSLYEIYHLSSVPSISVITLVQRLENSEFKNVCALVLGPSMLSSTLEKNLARH